MKTEGKLLDGLGELPAFPVVPVTVGRNMIMATAFLKQKNQRIMSCDRIITDLGNILMQY